jgi:hypothetical protein
VSPEGPRLFCQPFSPWPTIGWAPILLVVSASCPRLDRTERRALGVRNVLVDRAESERSVGEAAAAGQLKSGGPPVTEQLEGLALGCT